MFGSSNVMQSWTFDVQTVPSDESNILAAEDDVSQGRSWELGALASSKTTLLATCVMLTMQVATKD